MKSILILMIIIIIAGSVFMLNDKDKITHISKQLSQSENQLVHLRSEIVKKDSELVIIRSNSNELETMASMQIFDLQSKLNEAKILLENQHVVIEKDTVYTIIRDTIEVVNVMEMKADTTVTIEQHTDVIDITSDIGLQFRTALLLDKYDNLYWDHDLDVRIEKTEFNVKIKESSSFHPVASCYLLKDTDNSGFNFGLGAGIRKNSLSLLLLAGIRGDTQSWLQFGGMIGYEFKGSDK